MLKARAKLAQGVGDPGFLQGKITTARFYAEQIMPLVPALSRIVCDGAGSVMNLDEEQF
jgi:hypothetical protein